MKPHRDSYRKTVLLAVTVGLPAAGGLLGGAYWLGSQSRYVSIALAGTAVLVLGLLTIVVAAGLLVTYRDRLNERGEVDLFARLNAARSAARLAALPAGNPRPLAGRWLRRALGGPRYMVGDRVRVRPVTEILATLDERGCLGSLPFMPEMARWCGSEARVIRSVDKIYDYGGRKDMRRMTGCVTLTLPRCDGGAHDGCQAGCAFIWRQEWLEAVVGESKTVDLGGRPSGSQGAQMPTVLTGNTRSSDGAGYRCQFTALVAASTPMSSRDPRQDLRPLIAGNVTVAAFAVALATRLFNRLQHMRGGVGYLTVRPGAQPAPPSSSLGLKPGDAVMVRRPDEIAATLDSRGRNRGLWFDRDMLKHCGREYRVLRVVHRIIDDASGRALFMKTPCIILDGVNGSGEFMRFCPQDDYPFWREAWLGRPAAAADRVDARTGS